MKPPRVQKQPKALRVLKALKVLRALKAKRIPEKKQPLMKPGEMTQAEKHLMKLQAMPLRNQPTGNPVSGSKFVKKSCSTVEIAVQFEPRFNF
jgi:hypothetical protein